MPTQARKKELTRIEQGCEDASKKDSVTGPLECEVVTLYQGGQYWLYKYKRYDDVRLVLAPESAIATFGGDPDNFQFPRWSLDFTMLRAYENGKPVEDRRTAQVQVERSRRGRGSVRFGSPGRTDRLLTMSQLKFQRDAFSCRCGCSRYSELRGRLIQYGKQSPEACAARRTTSSAREQHKGPTASSSTRCTTTCSWTSAPAKRPRSRRRWRRIPSSEASTGNAWMKSPRPSRRNRNILLPYTCSGRQPRASIRSFTSYARALVRSAANAPSRTPSGCVNTRTRPCRGSSSRSRPTHPSTRTSKR